MRAPSEALCLSRRAGLALLLCGALSCAVDGLPGGGASVGDVGQAGDAAPGVEDAAPGSEDAAPGSKDAPEGADVPDAPAEPTRMLSAPEAGDPSQYDVSAPSSRLSALEIVEDRSAGDDLTGDGVVDNRFGLLIGQLQGLTSDMTVNEALAESIASGGLALGLSWRVEPVTAPLEGELELHFFNLQRAGMQYLIDPRSFLAGTRTPGIRFIAVVDAAGSVRAGPSSLEVTLPLFGQPTTLRLDRVRLRGSLLAGADGFNPDVTGGLLTGAIALESLGEAINGYFSSGGCRCMNLSAPLLVSSDGVLSCSGVGVEGSTCDRDGEPECFQIVQACELLLGAVAREADVDLSGDGSPEALSVSLRFEAVGVRLAGVSE